MGTYLPYYERCDMDFGSTWDEPLNANSGEMAIANPLLDLWAHCWTKSGWWFGTWILCFHSVGKNNPNWLLLIVFGLKPPTRHVLNIVWLQTSCFLLWVKFSALIFLPTPGSQRKEFRRRVSKIVPCFESSRNCRVKWLWGEVYISTSLIWWTYYGKGIYVCHWPVLSWELEIGCIRLTNCLRLNAP